MGAMEGSRLFNGVLLMTIVGEFLVPWILGRFYVAYDGKMMVMSALGSSRSPVRVFYNLWLVWLGIFLSLTAVVYFSVFRTESPALAVLVLLSIGIFAVGAGLISGLFSVNESKSTVTTASKIHGAAAAIGFMALLFFPLLYGIFSFRQNNVVGGSLSIVAFMLAVASFACFIMSDKPSLQNTPLKYEGIWERLTLFWMYLPFVYRAVGNLLL